MRLYLIPVMGICFSVDALLLMGTNRLTGHPIGVQRAALAAGLGAVYSGACLLPGLRFLGGVLWRLVSLVAVGMVSFGLDRSALRRTALFMVLNMAVGGLSMAFGGEQEGNLLIAAVVVCVLCVLGLRGRPGGREYVPVTLHYGEKQERVMALRDTGNTLLDPVTGESVLIVGSQVASRLLGLDRAQLASPVETMAARVLPGLRLIPYKAVGVSGGLLLALRMERVQIGDQVSSRLVAFAPEGLDGNGEFQALTGGAA